MKIFVTRVRGTSGVLNEISRVLDTPCSSFIDTNINITISVILPDIN